MRLNRIFGDEKEEIKNNGNKREEIHPQASSDSDNEKSKEEWKDLSFDEIEENSKKKQEGKVKQSLNFEKLRTRGL